VKSRAGVVLVLSGALLLTSLWMDWWGLPAAFHHPADLPSAAAFTAKQTSPLAADAFKYYDFRDILWVVAGVGGLTLGLLSLVRPRLSIPLAPVVGLLAIAALVFIAITLISPPDYADIGNYTGPHFDYGVDLPLSRDSGGFVALGAAIALVIGVGLLLVGEESRGKAATHGS
jgi:hypothetical protein